MWVPLPYLTFMPSLLFVQQYHFYCSLSQVLVLLLNFAALSGIFLSLCWWPWSSFSVFYAFMYILLYFLVWCVCVHIPWFVSTETFSCIPLGSYKVKQYRFFIESSMYIYKQNSDFHTWDVLWQNQTHFFEETIVLYSASSLKDEIEIHNQPKKNSNRESLTKKKRDEISTS